MYIHMYIYMYIYICIYIYIYQRCSTYGTTRRHARTANTRNTQHAQHADCSDTTRFDTAMRRRSLIAQAPLRQAAPRPLCGAPPLPAT